MKPLKTLGVSGLVASCAGRKREPNLPFCKFELITDWLPGRNLASTNSVKSAWEITPYYTRAYEKGCLFVRGDKPRELAAIAKITARQWRQYQNGKKHENPILKGLQFLRVFENESVRTYAQAAEILGVSRERVYQLTALVTKLPPRIKDFLASTDDPALLRFFTERRLRPLTLIPDGDTQMAQFAELLSPLCACAKPRQIDKDYRKMPAR